MAALLTVARQADGSPEAPRPHPTRYRTVQIDGLSIFYREAGPQSSDLSEPDAYRRDLPKAEVHVLDAGHFALDTAADEIAGLIRAFR